MDKHGKQPSKIQTIVAWGSNPTGDKNQPMTVGHFIAQRLSLSSFLCLNIQ